MYLCVKWKKKWSKYTKTNYTIYNSHRYRDTTENIKIKKKNKKFKIKPVDHWNGKDLKDIIP